MADSNNNDVGPTPPKFPLLDSVANRFEQNRKEQQNRLDAMVTRRETELVHSHYLMNNAACSPVDMLQAKSAASYWAKKHGVKDDVLTSRRRVSPVRRLPLAARFNPSSSLNNQSPATTRTSTQSKHTLSASSQSATSSHTPSSPSQSRHSSSTSSQSTSSSHTPSSPSQSRSSFNSQSTNTLTSKTSQPSTPRRSRLANKPSDSSSQDSNSSIITLDDSIVIDSRNQRSDNNVSVIDLDASANDSLIVWSPDSNWSLPRPDRSNNAGSRTSHSSGSSTSRIKRRGSSTSREERPVSPSSRAERRGSATSREERPVSPSSRAERRGSATSREERPVSPSSRLERHGSATSKEERHGSSSSHAEGRGSATSQEEMRGSSSSQAERRGSATSQEERRGSSTSQEERDGLSKREAERHVCRVLNCEAVFGSEGALGQHMNLFQHSPCSPCLRAANCKLAPDPLCYQCPDCDRDFQTADECSTHMKAENHSVFYPPLAVAGYLCPQCLHVFESFRAAWIHMERSSHNNICYPFTDDLAQSAGVGPVAVVRELVDDLVRRCERVPYRLQCLECSMELETPAILRHHWRETNGTHLVSVLCDSSLVDMFAEYIANYSCDVCHRLFTGQLKRAAKHDCARGVMGTIVDNDITSFCEFIKRCAMTLIKSVEPPRSPQRSQPRPGPSGCDRSRRNWVEENTGARLRSPKRNQIEILSSEDDDECVVVSEDEDTGNEGSPSSRRGKERRRKKRKKSRSKTRSGASVEGCGGGTAKADEVWEQLNGIARPAAHIDNRETVDHREQGARPRQASGNQVSAENQSSTRIRQSSGHLTSSVNQPTSRTRTPSGHLTTSVNDSSSRTRQSSGNLTTSLNDSSSRTRQPSGQTLSVDQSMLGERENSGNKKSTVNPSSSRTSQSSSNHRSTYTFPPSSAGSNPTGNQQASRPASAAGNQFSLKTVPALPSQLVPRPVPRAPISPPSQASSVQPGTVAAAASGTSMALPAPSKPAPSTESPLISAENLSRMANIIFLDLDNWAGFFTKLPRALPPNTFIWGFYGGRIEWYPPSRCYVYNKMRENGQFYLNERCGVTKDAADFAIVLSVGKMDERLPSNVAFTILSGDKGFKEVERQMRGSRRKAVVIDPHNASRFSNDMIYTMVTSVTDT